MSVLDRQKTCARLLIRLSVGCIFVSEEIQKVRFADQVGAARFVIGRWWSHCRVDADSLGIPAASIAVAGLTFLSGVTVAMVMTETHNQGLAKGVREGPPPSKHFTNWFGAMTTGSPSL
jgi:hypothetical protein